MNLTPLALVVGALCYSIPALAGERGTHPVGQQPPLSDPQNVTVPDIPGACNLADIPPDPPLIQQFSRQVGEGIKLFGKVMARSNWYEEINPAIGPTPQPQHMADNNSYRLWYYRLQQQVISGEKDDDLPELDRGVDDVIPETPTPVPPPPLTPQIPGYLALPAVLYSLQESLQNRFVFTAQHTDAQQQNLFMYYYRGGSQVRSPNGDADATSRYQGWLLGTRWRPQSASSPLLFSLGVHKGAGSLLPAEYAGKSQTRLKIHGVNGLISVQPPSGLQLTLPLSVMQYRGTVRSENAGDVAQINAVGISTGIETGWRWQYNAHSLTPLVGAGVQHLHLRDINDQQNARVRYPLAPQLQLSGGIKYAYQPAATLKLGVETQYVYHGGKTGKAEILPYGDFTVARGSHSLNVSGYLSWQVQENLTLTSQLQAQQRLGQTGTRDWNVMTGIELTF